MKKILLLSQLFLIFLVIVSAQEVTISFQPKIDTVSIDSVHVTNLTRGQTVKLLPGESVVFNKATSAEHPLLNATEEGFLYPNPSDGFTTLSFNTIQREKVFIAIYDMQGRMLISKTQNLMQGNHRFRLSFPAPGLYHITVLKNEKPLIYKIVYTGSNQQLSEIKYLGSDQIIAFNDQLKSALNGKSLDYSEGDVVHYTAFSGKNITVISDKPITTKTIEVEFYVCTDLDNRSYKIVQIGEQWWMAENLAYLPSVSPSAQGSDTEPYYYVYGYQGTDVAVAKQQANYTIYGVIYNWPAAMAGASSSSTNPSGVQGICPRGWHLPSDAEWEQLAQYISDQKGPYSKSDIGWQEVGKHLKATSGWNSDGNGTDDFGFSAFPGGSRLGNGYFGLNGTYGHLWSSSENLSSNAWYRCLLYTSSSFYQFINAKEFGFRVRCVRDLGAP